MSTPIITLEGNVNPDGTLQISEKVNLPAGKVHVTIVPVPNLPKDDPFWQMMERIWAGQRSRGHVARSAIEVEEERETIREEWEERMAEITRTQEEADRFRARSGRG
jgi:hypothetical protein